ncbi:MAG: anti-sigma factor antagonist [Clostridia bacterium]|nr:anti-sigma factor antagonist [Clostridia bacterium]
MQVNSRLYQETLYMTISGELDEHSANFARMNLDEQMSVTDCKQVVIDLSNLEFMDSTGIGVLLGRYKKMKQRGIPIYVTNPSTHADRIFKMTALYDVMPKIN